MNRNLSNPADDPAFLVGLIGEAWAQKEATANPWF
jgi:hypothetical protein